MYESWVTDTIAGPVGRLISTCNGRIARIRNVLLPRESQAIQAKKASQQTLDRTSVDTITELLHAYLGLPASWSANTSNVEAARRSIAPKKSTVCRDGKDNLTAFLLRGQDKSILAIPITAHGALNKYIQRQVDVVVIKPPKMGPVSFSISG